MFAKNYAAERAQRSLARRKHLAKELPLERRVGERLPARPEREALLLLLRFDLRAQQKLSARSKPDMGERVAYNVEHDQALDEDSGQRQTRPLEHHGGRTSRRGFQRFQRRAVPAASRGKHAQR